MVSGEELFSAEATDPYFQYPKKSSNQVVYVITGTYHRQGTGNFLLRINLEIYDISILADKP